MGAVLGSLTPEQFLEQHWQKKPALIRGALPGFRSPLSPEELAGLACEEEVESRLIQGRVGTSWRLEHGPFPPERFERLPERDWTLLVQDVDKWVPALAPLLEHCRYLPEWRVDDIMVSFAAPGGSVGPHTDRYDVFLLQAHGRRRWQLSEHFDPSLIAGIDLKILRSFEPEREYVVEPGDVLYLPPNVAHFGVAVDEAMTFSVGFRAPDQRELVSAFAEELMQRAAPERRFRDAGRTVAVHPSRLEEADLAQLRQLMRQGLAATDAELDGFIGRHLTRNKPHLEVEGESTDEATLKRRLARGGQLVRRPGARYAHVLRGDAVWLFADGREHRLPRPHLGWLEALLSGVPFDAAQLERHPAAPPWLVALLGQGSLEWVDARA